MKYFSWSLSFQGAFTLPFPFIIKRSKQMFKEHKSAKVDARPLVRLLKYQKIRIALVRVGLVEMQRNRF